jgi:hypothetical protein
MCRYHTSIYTLETAASVPSVASHLSRGVCACTRGVCGVCACTCGVCGVCACTRGVCGVCACKRTNAWAAAMLLRCMRMQTPRCFCGVCACKRLHAHARLRCFCGVCACKRTTHARAFTNACGNICNFRGFPSQKRCVRMHAHVACMRRTHAHALLCMQKQKQTRLQIHAETHVCMRMHAHDACMRRTHARLRMHAETYVCACARTTHACAFTNACGNICHCMQTHV